MLNELESDLLREQRHHHNFSISIRLMAQFISVVFHPMFILSYAYVGLAFFNPFLFGETNMQNVFRLQGAGAKGIWFINLVLFSCIIPLFGIFLMKMLNIIQSITLKSREERKLPYVLTGIFYLSMVAQNSINTSLPIEIKIFCLGATIALFMAFFINLFSKISIHTVGAGGFLAMLIVIMARAYFDADILIILGFMTCGLVGTSRLILGAHGTRDVYWGFFIGFLAQFVAINYMFS